MGFKLFRKSFYKMQQKQIILPKRFFILYGWQYFIKDDHCVRVSSTLVICKTHSSSHDHYILAVEKLKIIKAEGTNGVDNHCHEEQKKLRGPVSPHPLPVT